MALPRASTETLQNIAQNMGKPPTSKQFESSYKKILKQLNRTFYNVSTTGISTEDPLFTSVVLLDIKTQKLRKNLSSIGTNRLVQSVGETNLTLGELNKSRSASAFYSQYQQRSAPLINEAGQRQLQKEELETAINTYIDDMQTELLNISNDKKRGKSDKEIRQMLVELSKQADNLLNRINKLDVNVYALHQHLDQLNREMTTLLPAQERKVTEEEVRRERLGGRGEY